MNRREAVCHALDHEETDCLPYQLQFTADTAEKIKDHFDADNAHEALGNFIRPVQCPWWGFDNVPEDFHNDAVPAELPPTFASGSFEDFAENLTRVRERTDAYILVPIYAFNFEKAWMLRGMENFMLDMGRAPDFVEKLLGKILEINRVMLQLLVGYEEIDGFLLGSDWGGQRGLLIGPRQWRRFIKDTEAQCYDIVRDAGKDLWVHSCGNIRPIIPDLIETGVQGLNPVQSEVMDIAELKADFGEDLTFWGGVSTQQILPYGTTGEVREDVERTIDIMAPGGGYVLGPSQSMQDDVPLENVLAFHEVARAHAGM